MSQLRVAVIAGSVRSESVHRRLALVLAERLRAAGVEAVLIDLADHPMPIYDGDLEDAEGPPAPAQELTELLRGFDGLVLVTPEHNGGPSALLKNTIDWITRVDRSVFAPLLIGLAAASPGSRGGATGLAAMQRLAEHMRLEIAPVVLSVPHAGDAFAERDGATALARIDDIERAAAFVDGFVAALVARSQVTLAG
jgi:NAD(P)H-dependent FMN reductase